MDDGGRNFAIAATDINIAGAIVSSAGGTSSIGAAIVAIVSGARVIAGTMAGGSHPPLLLLARSSEAL